MRSKWEMGMLTVCAPQATWECGGVRGICEKPGGWPSKDVDVRVQIGSRRHM